jgi:hypothetical protein
LWPVGATEIFGARNAICDEEIQWTNLIAMHCNRLEHVPPQELFHCVPYGRGGLGNILLQSSRFFLSAKHFEFLASIALAVFQTRTTD